jgi:hypothetical protein
MSPTAHKTAWSKLSRLAAAAPPEALDLPFSFAMRIVAAWRSDRRENTLAAFEWLTVRGLAVAVLIFAGSAAFGYDTLAGVLDGETSLVGGWLDTLLPAP